MDINEKLGKELNDYALEFAKEYVKEGVGLCAFINLKYPSYKDADPLDVQFYWDEEGWGEIATANLREEYLERFNDDPEYCAPHMPAVIASLRSLANEIEKIYKSTTSEVGTSV